jgi:hypothetical protein
VTGNGTLFDPVSTAMTDRIHSITLVLDEDIREDDVQPLLDACRMLRHVISVTPNVSDFELHTAEERTRRRVVDELHEATRKILGYGS